MNRPQLLLLGLCTACAGSRGDHLSALRPGSFVEAKGAVTDGAPRVDEVDEVGRGVDDKSDKVEVTGPVERADPQAVHMLGHRFAVDAATEFESEDKQQVAPFTPAAGDWLRIKARVKDDTLRARSLRAMGARDQFKVTGEVRSVDADRRLLDVGGVVLPLGQDVDVGLTGNRDPNDPLSLFLADDQKGVPFTLELADNLRLGGQASFVYQHQDEYDLDRALDRDRQKRDLDGKLDLLWLIDEHGSYGLFEVTGGFHETQRQNSPDSHDDVFEISRAYASVRLGEHLQAIVGRQDFTDEREWLYDEVLDGARLVARCGDFEFEASASQGRQALAERNDFEDTSMAAAFARLHIDRDWQLTAYVLRRDDASAADFEPLLYGLRSYSRQKHGLSHWVELARAEGHDGVRDIDGYAIDVGATWSFDLPWRPTLVGGIAFGSGERDGATHEGFRQTGLHNDNGKFGSVTKLRYYGEVFDPELANLLITTAGLTVRPLPDVSVTAVFHSFAQDVGSTQFPNSGNSSLRASPIGTATELGREYDLVIGYRYSNLATLELVYGRFDPGAAFFEEAVAQKFELTARFGF